MPELYVEMIDSIAEMNAKIEAELFRILEKKFNINFFLVNQQLVEEIKTIIKNKIRENHTYISLLKNEPGELLPELGLPHKIRLWAADAMLELIAEGVELGINCESIKNNEVIINIDVVWTNDASQALLQRGEAFYISGRTANKKRVNSYDIPWLEWLLDGGSAFITGYHISLSDEYQKGSRTGFALMKKGGDWRFPDGYQNNPDQNFITESIEAAQHSIQQLIVNKLS